MPYQSEKEKVYRIEISDCIGNDLSPGMIIAYAAGAKLKFGVYEGVAKIKDFYTSFSSRSLGAVNGRVSYRYRIQICTVKSGKVRRNIVGAINYDKDSDEFSNPENLVVVKNPLYHLGSKEVAMCLQAIDRLKDEGHLPHDFKAK